MRGGNDAYNARQVDERARAAVAELSDRWARNRKMTLAAVEEADDFAGTLEGRERMPDEYPTTDPVRIEFADERFTDDEAAAHSDWRELTPYERAILERLLEVDFDGRAGVVDEALNVRVRQIDRCGCLEFRTGVEATGEATVVAEGGGPEDEFGFPVEIMLTLRGGHLLWLEFHRYGGRNDYSPEAIGFRVGPLMRMSSD